MVTLLELHTPDTIAAVNIEDATVVQTGDTDVHNGTVVPDQEYFDNAYKTISTWHVEEHAHLWYSKAMFIFWGAVLAIGTVFNGLQTIRTRQRTSISPNDDSAGALPAKATTSNLWRKLQAYLLLPATFSRRCDQSAIGGTIPPRAETILLSLFVILNVVLCAVTYNPFSGNVWFTKDADQIWRYFADRTGYLSYANLTISWAFGIRNNILIWITGWNFPTFNRFHRWVARVATLEAILHSAAYTIYSFRNGGFAAYALNYKEEYWYTGVIATCTMSLVLLFSILWFRVRFYDFFLITHILLSLVTLVNLFYHTKLFEGQFDGFLWPTVAFWGFDRLYRIGRVVYTSVRSSSLKGAVEYSAEHNILRIDVTAVFNKLKPAGGSYYFLYSPFSLRGWESHPFTLIRWRESSTPSTPISQSSQDISLGDDKFTSVPISRTDSLADSSDRYTFIIRPYKGFTSRLARQAAGASKTFLYEGPYGHAPSLNNFTDVLFIIGGSGISVAISSIYDILEHNAYAKIHLVWASRSPGLIDSVLSRELRCAVESGRLQVNAHLTRSGKASEKNQEQIDAVSTVRPGIAYIMRDVAAENAGALAVVACGPAEMMDDTRAAFVRELKSGKGEMKLFLEAFVRELKSGKGEMKLFLEAFSW